MTPRERVLMAMKHQGKPDRPPFEVSWGAFTPGLMKVYREKTGTNLCPEEYFDFDTRWININPCRKNTDFKKYFGGTVQGNTTFDEWGVGRVPGSIAVWHTGGCKKGGCQGHEANGWGRCPADCANAYTGA